MADVDPVAAVDPFAALAREQQRLDAVVVPLEPGQWAQPTPSPGWDIRDQIIHLAWFDAAATRALVEPAVFRSETHRAAEEPEAYAHSSLAWGRGISGDEVLRRWRQARTDLQVALDGARTGRVDWFGHPMAVRSLATARLMETWAHGLDVWDALGMQRAEDDDVAAAIAWLGWRALPFAFEVSGLDRPDRPVRLELVLPSGAPLAYRPSHEFSHGPPDGADVVRGSAVDFCLLVTQRRHLDDLSLTVEGAVAARWVQIAQAFAGPPGSGRPPRRGAAR